MQSGGCFEKERICLSISVHDTGSSTKAFELRLLGTPHDCLRKLEVETLRYRSWCPGFRLSAQTGFQSPKHAILTDAQLYSACSFGGGRLGVDLCRNRFEETHLQWLHRAVVRVQRLWRQKLDSYWKSDAQDIMCTFKLSIEKHNFKYISADALAQHDARLEEVLPLAMVAATCRAMSDELTPMFFRHLEKLASSFCIKAASTFLQQIQGLDFSRARECLPALEEIIRSFLGFLGQAFSWLHQSTVLQQGISIGAQRVAIQQRRRQQTRHADVDSCSIANEVWSHVVSWVLHDIDEALAALGSKFQNSKLRQRLMETPRLKEKLEKELNELLSRPLARPWFVSISSVGVAGVQHETQLLYILQAGQNFGGLVQAAFPYFGIAQGQLFLAHDVSSSGEPMLLEHTPEVLGAQGLVLSVIVKPQVPPASSINYALNEICKQLGSNFLFQREDCVLKFTCPKTLSYRILLPCDGLLANDDQYYHIYSEHDFQMTTLHGQLPTLLNWVRAQHAQHNGASRATSSSKPPFHSSAAFEFLEPVCLQQEVDRIFGNIQTGKQSTIRSFFSSLGSCVPAGVSSSSFPYGSRMNQDVNLTEPSWSQFSKYMLEASSWATDVFTPCQVQDGAQVNPDLASFFSGAACKPAHAVAFVDKESETANGPETNESESSESADEDTESPQSVDKSSRGNLALLSFSPDIVRSATVGAAACASQIVTVPQTTFITQQVLSSLGDGRMVVSGQAGSWIGASVASAAGAIGGAALGSALGPAGTIAGSVLGMASGNAICTWQAQHQIVHSDSLTGYRFARSNADGHMYLTYKHQSQPHAQSEFLLSLVLAQTSLNGVRNLWSLSQGKMTCEDVGRAAVRDLKDGLLLSFSSQGILHGLKFGQQHGAYALSTICAQALQHPVPVLLSVLGTGLVVSGCISHFTGARSSEQLQSDTLLVVGVNSTAIAAHMACAALQMPCFSSMIATCAVSNAMGFWIYEAWHEERQASLEEKLLCMARAIFGLCPDYDEKILRHRWRLLVRMAHPDKNRCKDAKITFNVLRQCKDVLDGYASGARPPRTKTTFWRLVQLSISVSRSMQLRIAAC
eukprot:TRINITY_DN59279_c0_g1_i1.p1 TRINITY_DN59279_c0_g1~~TRINITY_DN59279_c0_g1_i1.p1  ORF type:complete len:1085 (-),score=162.44 TRINITY_DN59279_c0_g1_i1:426-3680(-)